MKFDMIDFMERVRVDLQGQEAKPLTEALDEIAEKLDDVEVSPYGETKLAEIIYLACAAAVRMAAEPLKFTFDIEAHRVVHNLYSIEARAKQAAERIGRAA
jgi:hypothetical protein